MISEEIEKEINIIVDNSGMWDLKTKRREALIIIAEELTYTGHKDEMIARFIQRVYSRLS